MYYFSAVKKISPLLGGKKDGNPPQLL